MANGNIPFLANINMNGNEIKDVKLEILVSDPAELTEARFWYNSATKLFKFYDGTNVVVLGNGIYIKAIEKGAANGVAPLGADSKVEAQYLPSYVDDVVDSYIVAGATPLSAGWLSKTEGGSALTPETGKIYVVLTDGEYVNKTYRWSGTTYVEISASNVYTAGNGLDLTAGAFSIKLDTPNANGLSVGASGLALAEATQNGAGAMSAADKVNLDTLVTRDIKKYTATNPALTASGGIASWTVTHSMNTSDVVVAVTETASPYADVVVDVLKAGANAITINFVSDSNIAAGTYKVVIIG